MRKQRNLIGKKFGKLIAIESLGNNGIGHYMTKVKCECGKIYNVPDTELIKGRRTGCRSCNTKIHGKTNTKLFNVWQSMKQRCYDKNNKNYYLYGERNITVCDEWKNDFLEFYNWSIKNGYKEKLSIDRIDVNKGYEPSNCRWADKYTQANNKRNNVYIEFKNKKYTISELSRKYNIKSATLSNRIKSGWDIEKAIKTKPIVGRNQYWKNV